MSENPANLRLYASIFLKKRRWYVGDILHEPSEIEKAAAKALIDKAERIEGGMSTEREGA